MSFLFLTKAVTKDAAKVRLKINVKKAKMIQVVLFLLTLSTINF